MSQSSRKLICNLTVNRGVEAKEIEIKSHQLGAEAAAPRAGGGDASARPRSPSPSDRSTSYIQVMVKKQRTAAPSPARASPAAVLLACPALAALQPQWEGVRPPGPANALIAEFLPGNRADVVKPLYKSPNPNERTKRSIWRKIRMPKIQEFGFAEGVDCIEVYQFERGAAFLSARDAAPTRVQRAARALGRPAAAALAECLAAPRVLMSLPIAVALQVERCLLGALREALGGALQTASDQLLKPALALLFNALVAPPLVCVAQTASALRDALRPATLALGDALEPLARLLAAPRLLHVERRCCHAQHV